MLQISSLSKAYGPRSLFSGVSMMLTPGNRYGLVGANGAGKTTLLRILTGDEAPSDGAVTIPKSARVGVLRQDRFMDDSELVAHVAMRGDERVFDALREQEGLVAQDEVDAVRLSELEEVIARFDGYTLESRASAVLVGLGVPPQSLQLPLSTLSGGFKLRVQLAQLLVGEPDILLLDEPTNHLDILSIAWLEQFLQRYQGCAVVISHDHRFLSTVATHMLDVDYGTITAYTGGYADFVNQKALARAQREAEIARAERIVAEKKAFVERFKAKATKARQAQSRVKQIEKIEIAELPPTSRRAPLFRFEPRRHSGKEVVTAQKVSKAYGDKQVLKDAGLMIRRGERVGIIGANGLGKSTLLKILVGVLKADAGEVQWGHEAHVGYFAQDHAELLSDPKATPLNVIWDTIPEDGTATVRGHLGRVLFSNEEVDKPVSSLSGGEAARLIFCKLMVEKPNILVLDEPTNHLDIEAIEALVGALKDFDGTVVFVSHDRWFVSELATRIIEVKADGLHSFEGSYAEFQARGAADHLDKQEVSLRARQEQREKKAQNSDGGTSWEERKRQANRLKALPKKRDAVMESIESKETSLQALRARYCEAGFFETTESVEVDRLRALESQLELEIERLTTEWEQLEEEIAELEGTS